MSYSLSHDPPFSTIGLFTYKRTYARRVDELKANSEVETFQQTLNRVISASDTQLNCDFADDEKREFYGLLYNLKCSVAGRFMWQLGSKTVDRLGLLSLQNCAYTEINDPVRPFTWAFDALMLGSGVGYSIEREHVDKIPPVKKLEGKIARIDSKDADFVVPDSREGWVKLLGKVLKAYFYSGKGFTYSCVLVRGKGAPIKSFGGIASGPESFCKGLEQICGLLGNATGRQLTSVECMDIMCIIGSIVVSGNVRRSAQIAIGDCNDIEYLSAKRWDKGNIPNWRAFSNNTVRCDDITNLPDEFWEGYKGNGEPYGLFNRRLARECGRVGDTRYPDPNVSGTNPCSEQTLENKEVCCLAEIFLPNVDSKDELFKCIKYLYRMCKRSLLLPCHLPETQDVVRKNMRIGIGITGYLQAREEQREWLPDAYTYVRDLDKKYSQEHKIPESIKLTTVKPSGTLSLLGNCTSGIHPAYSQYYIRRVRFSSDSPLLKIAEDNGYYTEYVRRFDGSEQRDTKIVEFPCETPKGTLLAKDCTAIDQLEIVKRMNKEWSDNAVSVTVYYRKEELDDIKTWLKNNFNDNLKAVSFLLHNDHGFDQAPLEEISKERYDELNSKCKPIRKIESYFNQNDDDLVQESSCPGGSCPIR